MGNNAVYGCAFALAILLGGCVATNETREAVTCDDSKEPNCAEPREIIVRD